MYLTISGGDDSLEISATVVED